MERKKDLDFTSKPLISIGRGERIRTSGPRFQKWVYLKDKIVQEMNELADDDSPRAIVRREKLENYLTTIAPEDLACLITADTGFSVYDDLKAALIDKGIPANEVRFIHEANTASQKEELFDQVRAGQVRVLIGSTKKMGAGTNVQDRAVALHHMDAPWRPSDVEQREGRVIRQGNLLYARDPENFAVEVMAYSTSNTFDAVMWQILSRKAGMLEQFRLGTRSVTNVEGDSASYAEFMAESTGNPIFKEKFHLEAEVEELESVERNIRTQRASADRTWTNAARSMKHLTQILREWKGMIHGMTETDHVVFEGTRYNLDIEEGRAKVLADFEAAEAEWESVKAKYVVDVEKWQMDVENGLFGIGDALDKKAMHAAKPAKPTGAPQKPTLKEVAEVSQFAQLMLSINHRFKASAKGVIGTIHVNGTQVEISKTLYMDRAYATVAINGEELWDKSSRPEDMVLRFANPEAIKSRAEANLRGAYKDLKDKARNIRNARVTIRNLTFTGANDLSEKRIRLDFISEEINRVEEELSALRNAQANRYIQGDAVRFPGSDIDDDDAILIPIRPDKARVSM